MFSVSPRAYSGPTPFRETKARFAELSQQFTEKLRDARYPLPHRAPTDHQAPGATGTAPAPHTRRPPSPERRAHYAHRPPHRTPRTSHRTKQLIGWLSRARLLIAEIPLYITHHQPLYIISPRCKYPRTCLYCKISNKVYRPAIHCISAISEPFSP